MFPKRPRNGSAFLEFEVTRHAHMSSSVMFKDAPGHLLSQAWEILLEVCRGKELFPDTVNTWMKDALKNYTGQEQEHAIE